MLARDYIDHISGCERVMKDKLEFWLLKHEHSDRDEGSTAVHKKHRVPVHLMVLL